MDFMNRNTGSSAASSDRLRKAIERNRAKVAKKAPKQPHQYKAENSSLIRPFGKAKREESQVSSARIHPRELINHLAFQQLKIGQSPLLLQKIEILKARRQNLTSDRSASVVVLYK